MKVLLVIVISFITINVYSDQKPDDYCEKMAEFGENVIRWRHLGASKATVYSAGIIFQSDKVTTQYIIDAAYRVRTYETTPEIKASVLRFRTEVWYQCSKRLGRIKKT